MSLLKRLVSKIRVPVERSLPPLEDNSLAPTLKV